MRRTVGSHRSIDAMTSPVKTRFRACAALAIAAGSRALRPGLPESLPLALRRLDAGLRALGNQRAFELRDRAEDLKGKHALGCRSVDGVAQRSKVGAALLQPLDDVEEVADRAGEAVEADDDEDIAGPDLAHQSGELWPSPRRARAVLLVNCRAASCAQLIGLGVGGLILGGDPRVAQKTSCRAGRGAGEGSAGHELLLSGRCGPVCTISEVAGKRPFAGVSEPPVQPRPHWRSAGPQARQPYAWRAFEALAASKPTSSAARGRLPSLRRSARRPNALFGVGAADRL